MTPSLYHASGSFIDFALSLKWNEWGRIENRATAALEVVEKVDVLGRLGHDLAGEDVLHRGRTSIVISKLTVTIHKPMKIE